MSEAKQRATAEAAGATVFYAEAEREATTRARADAPGENPELARRREEERLRREGISGEVRGYIEPAPRAPGLTNRERVAKAPSAWTSSRRRSPGRAG